MGSHLRFSVTPSKSQGEDVAMGGRPCSVYMSPGPSLAKLRTDPKIHKAFQVMPNKSNLENHQIGGFVLLNFKLVTKAAVKEGAGLMRTEATI